MPFPLYFILLALALLFAATIESGAFDAAPPPIMLKVLL